MKTKRTISIILALVFVLGLLPAQLATTVGADTVSAAAVTFTVEADGNTFTVRRSANGALPVQTVRVRTVDLTALAGVHYTGLSQTVTFGANVDSMSFTITEKTSTQITNIVNRYQTGTKRSYRFEVLDTEGFYLASVKRDITYDASYSFNNEYVMPNNGEHLIYLAGNGDPLNSGTNADMYCDQPHTPYVDVSFPGTSGWTTIKDRDGNGYALNGVWTASTDDLYDRDGCASRDYLNAVGDKMYGTIAFTGTEVDDGYQYIQILADNSTSCDGKDDNGSVNNPSVSLYKACFELDEKSGGINKDREFYGIFPTLYLTNSDYPENKYLEINTFGKRYAQKFKTNSLKATNTGALVLDTTVNSLSVRFNARGGGDDDWKFKNMFARLAIVDLQAPTVLGAAVSAGPYYKHNRVTVTLMFSEIVKPQGALTLHTSWGDLTAEGVSGSSYANAVAFTGVITANAGMQLRITGMEGTLSDLQGRSVASVSRTFDSNSVVGTTPTPTMSNGSYVIKTVSDLYWYADQLVSNPTVSAVLDNDISMSTSAVSVFNGMAPNGFVGTFDGQGHTIDNLTVKDGTTAGVGLFIKTAANGKIKNLTVGSGCTFSAATPVNLGGITGQNAGTIENCVMNGTVTALYRDSAGSGKGIGGICGVNTGTVRNCLVGGIPLHSNITNRWNGATVGGIVGINSGTLTGSMFYGLYNDISMTNITRGAVCGSNTGTVTNCAGVHNNNNYMNGAIGSNTGTATNVTFAEDAAFFSGEVCWQVNDRIYSGNQAWYQTVNSGELPAFSGETVYAHGDIYANTSEHTWGAPGYEWVFDEENDEWACCGILTCTVCQENLRMRCLSVTCTGYVAPSCTTAGYKDLEASFSGNEYGFEDQTGRVAIPALGHDYGEPEYLWSFPLTSNYDGEKTVFGHDFGVLDPRVSNNGDVVCYALVACSRCGSTVDEYGAVTLTSTVEETCTEPGENVYTAEFEDEFFTTQTMTEEIPASGHAWGEWDTVWEASCVDDGTEERWCVACDAYEQRSIPAFGHNWVKGLTWEPTCEDEGYTEYWCSYCGDYKVDDFVDPLGHTANEVSYSWGEFDNTLTCSAHFTCTICGEEICDEATSVTRSEIPATCTHCGITRYTASGFSCDFIEDAVKEVDNPEDYALGHDFSGNTLARTVFNEDYTRVTGIVSCSRCTETEQETVDFNMDPERYVAPGCETYGYVYGSAEFTIARPGETIWLGQSIDPLQHDWQEGETVPATCEADGYTVYECSRCHWVEHWDTTPALGHNWVVEGFAWDNLFNRLVFKATCANDPSHEFCDQRSYTENTYESGMQNGTVRCNYIFNSEYYEGTVDKALGVGTNYVKMAYASSNCYRFTAQSSGWYRIYSGCALSTDPCVTAFCNVESASPKEIASDYDISENNNNFSMVFYIEAGDTYLFSFTYEAEASFDSGYVYIEEMTPHAVTVANSAHGTLIATPSTGRYLYRDAANAAAGSGIYLEAYPDPGYALSFITITDSQGNEIEYNTDSAFGTEFTMPDDDVTVTPVFTERVPISVSADAHIFPEEIHLVLNGDYIGDSLQGYADFYAAEGADATLTFKPRVGYAFFKAKLNGADVTGSIVYDDEYGSYKLIFTVPEGGAAIELTTSASDLPAFGGGMVNDPANGLYTLTVDESWWYSFDYDEDTWYTLYDKDGCQNSYGSELSYLIAGETYYLQLDSNETENSRYFSVTALDSVHETPYNVTLQYDDSCGTVTVDLPRAGFMDTVNVTVIPKAGYGISTACALNAEGGQVSRVYDRSFSFLMPDNDVTVEVVFAPLQVSNPITVSDIYASVPYHVFCDGVELADLSRISAGAPITAVFEAPYGYGVRVEYACALPVNELESPVNTLCFVMPDDQITLIPTLYESSHANNSLSLGHNAIRESTLPEYYSFTPSETGVYAFSGDDLLNWEIESAFNLETKLLYAGTTYEFTIWDDNAQSAYLDFEIALTDAEPDHTITVLPSTHGKVIAEHDVAADGDKVKLSIIPEAGYSVSDLRATDSNGAFVSIDADACITVTDDVTVSAKFSISYVGITMRLIDTIGTVTLDSEYFILRAEEYYSKLTTAEQTQVSNFDTLVAAREAYDALVASPAILWGDVSGDGAVTGIDASLILQYVANYDDATGTSSVALPNFAAANVNCDSGITTIDASLILQYVANYDDETGTSSVHLGPQD